MNNDRAARRRTLVPAIGILTAMVAFGGGVVGAPAVFGEAADPHAGDAEGPVTPRTVVATGQLKEFGPYELVASKDADGASCVGIRLPEGPPGTPLLAEGCGPTVESQVGSIVTTSGRKPGTVFFGRVDSRSDRVTISAKGQEKKVARAVPGADGHRYVVTESGESLPDAEVVLDDDRGNRIGRADPASVSG